MLAIAGEDIVIGGNPLKELRLHVIGAAMMGNFEEIHMHSSLGFEQSGELKDLVAAGIAGQQHGLRGNHSEFGFR